MSEEMKRSETTVFEETMEKYLEYITSVRGLSRRTIDSYRRDLLKFSAFLSGEGESGDNGVSENGDERWKNMQSKDVRRFISYLMRLNLQKSSINRILSSLRGFYAFCQKFEYTLSNPFSSIRGVKGSAALPEVLTENEIQDVLSRTREDYLGRRDRALFEVLYSTGCRVSEVSAMELSDIGNGKQSIRVLGKGNKERFVFLGKLAVEALDMYISMRRQHVNKDDRDAQKALFLNASGRRLTQRGIADIISRYTRDSALSKKVSPHTFRHSFATHLVDRGVDIRVVQELLGHSSVSTTQVYTHVGIERLRDVYSRAHPHASSGDREKRRKQSGTDKDEENTHTKTSDRKEEEQVNE